MATLLYQTKIEFAYPVGSTTFKVERFQTDSYSVRAAMGINNADVKYQVVWGNLTATEATALIASFDALKGVSTVDYKPLLSTTTLKFTVTDYIVTEYPGVAKRYRVEANLTKEYQ
jgi:phage-related protein